MSSGEVKHWFQGSSWWPECVALLSANVPLVGSLHWQTRWSPSECLQVSPKMSSTFLHLVISRHISSICGALDFDPYAIGCFKMFQDPLSIVQLFLNWLHLQNGPSKPFFLVHPLVHHKIWSVWNIVKSISIISKLSFYFIFNPLMLVSSTQISTTWTQHPLDVRKDAESVGLPRRILQLGIGHLGAKRQNLPSK